MAEKEKSSNACLCLVNQLEGLLLISYLSIILGALTWQGLALLLVLNKLHARYFFFSTLGMLTRWQ